MQYYIYPPLARRTAKALPFYEGMKHAALGCGSDMGEVATLVKKMTVYGAKLTDVQKDGRTLLQHFEEELGDVCWFIVEGCHHMGLQFSQDVTYGTTPDDTYSSYRNLDKSIDYWTMKGISAAGRINDLVASGEANLSVLKFTVQMWFTAVFTCVCQIAFRLNLSMHDILEKNIEKLSKRYPGAYTDADALARRDKVS